ncbi:MAG: peptidoglycan-binding domain-containing protein [Candidatus Omnitrophota bacterium]
MFKKLTLFFVLPLFVLSLAGCATCRKQSSEEMQGLRNQVSVLEAQVQEKDEEISSLKDSLAAQMDRASASRQNFAKKSVASKSKSRLSAKQIQIALKNAGYNPGAIDGKIGRQTREAIKAFQKDNGLKADGIVGKQTRQLLAEYLYKKVK